MDTPITISSTLSSIGKLSKKVTKPQSESSIARVPVSWDSPLKPCERELNCTPSTLQKVNNWINSLSRLREDIGDSNSGSLRQSSDFSDFDIRNGLYVEGDLVNSTIIMSDYNKSELKGQGTEDEFDHYSRSPYYYENVEGSQSTSKTADQTYGGRPKKYVHPKAVKRRKSLQKYKLAEEDNDTSDDYDSDEPLSPESEKKKELCSYLQLMKPTDKKTVMILQNRRSVRVKNLSIMQEKRELEKKLKETNAGNINENNLPDNTGIEQTCPTLKSFDEMNISLNKKKYKWLKYRGTKDSNNSFCFPEPTYNLRHAINDFDNVKFSWFEKTTEDASRKQHVCSENPFIQSIEPNKKNDSNIVSQIIKRKNKISVDKPHIHSTSENIKFRKRKTETAKNDSAQVPKNVKVKNSAKAKEVKTIDNNKGKTKLADKNKKRNVTGTKRKKENINKTNKSQGHPELSNAENLKLQSLNASTKAQFQIPKPSKQLVHDMNDFDVIIKNNKDLVNNPSQSSGINVGDNINTKSKLLDKSVPTSLDTSKSKISSSKKRIKTKKLNTERNVRRSSFKIKLKPKRKALGFQSRSEKKSTRSKSPLIADIMRSLRSRNITPTSEIISIKNKLTKKKQNLLNRKENIKQKVQNGEQNIKPKHSENPIEGALKVPLKDTNKNAVKSTHIPKRKVSSSNDINLKITNGDSHSPTDEKTTTRVNSLQDLMPDVDFCSLSTEHKTSLLVKNINQDNSSSQVPIIAIYHKDNSDGLESNCLKDKTKERGEFYSQILNIEKYPDDDIPNIGKSDAFEEEISPSNVNRDKECSFKNNENQLSLLESSIENEPEFHGSSSVSKGPLTPVSSKGKSDANSDKIQKLSCEATPFILFKKDTDVKSLHKCLNSLTPKSVPANLEVENSPASWSSESPSHKRKKSQHSINIFKEHGAVLKAFYLEYNLILCQEFMVSFWTQTALGNVLGAQNMWIYKGSIQRMAMNNNCIFKESLEMVVSTDNNVAYIELWTKEHESDIREGPVADVFATVYFWKKGQNGLDKKVLQLENINGFADDVQYSVVKSTPRIIVSWHLACSELDSKKTYIHCYQLAADYQAVYNISEFEAVQHYVSSLHNIEGCDSLIMGCGENKITLWNIEYGYVVATIEMSEIKSPLSTLWVRCDRGFLFTLQQCVDKELRLIAIHGMNHSWKKLASYIPPDEYDRLKGVCVENGMVLAFYDQGVICWNAQTAEIMVEESHNEAQYISGKYVICVDNDQISIRHAITHLLSLEDL